MWAAAFNHNHCSVVEVAHSLSGLFSRPHDANFSVVAGQKLGFHGVGQIVQIDHVDAVQPCDFVQVEIVGD